MREIKFRMWHKEQAKMYSAEELGEDQLTLMPDGRGFANISGDNTKLSQIDNGRKMVPLQCTGLLDVNGKEIYEGDIVLKTFRDRPYSRSAKSKKIKCEVYWDCHESGFAQSEWAIKELEPLGNSRCYDGGPLFMVEVIGNIYEDNHLLERHDA